MENQPDIQLKNHRDFVFGEIKYKPKLSCISIKYVGLVLMSVWQFGFIVFLILVNNDVFVADWVMDALHSLNNLVMPLLLISIFSIIVKMRGKELAKNVLTSLIAMAAFYAVEFLMLFGFIVPFFNELASEIIGLGVELDFTPILTTLLSSFMNMNVFIDIFLCSLICFFLYYTPKICKTKVSRRLFRALVALPIGYILWSYIALGLVHIKVLKLNIYVSALLTHRTIMTYVFFGLMLLYMSLRSRLYDKINRVEGRSFDDYSQSNRSALNFAIVLGVLLCLVSLLDFGLSFIPALEKWQIGKASLMFLAAPVLLLYDYRISYHHIMAKRLVPAYYFMHYWLLAALAVFGLT